LTTCAEYSDVATLAAVIARSPIVVRRPVSGGRSRDLPVGFEDVDLAVLEWIAAEARRAGRGLVPM
jgi:hypothetical protein